MAAKHGMLLVAPDTSPRGADVPDDPDGAYDFGLGAAQESEHADRVGADVHQGAAGEVQAVADIPREEHRDAE